MPEHHKTTAAMPPPEPAASGPEELLRLKREYLIPCVYHFYQRPPQIVAGEGCWLIDQTGKRYLDCYSGVTVMSAGHANREIIEPAIEQIRRLQHTTTIYLTEPVLRLAEQLAAFAPGGIKRSFFCTSGSEATEGALLLAGLKTGRTDIIAMHNGLHGRTRWAMNATGLEMWRTDPAPLESVHHVPFGDAAALEVMLADHCGRIAAVIAEPIQGNGGINVPPPDYWPMVRQICNDHEVLLIFDEVQTGLGRTGRWFAAEHWNVVPDIMTVSKALGNGFPISAFMTTDEIATAYTRPGASTSGGNPVAATAALATLRYHQTHQLAARAATLGEALLSGLDQIAADHRCLAQARGKGLMLGVEVIDDREEPDPQRLDAILEALKDRGILCGKTGSGRNVLTLLPPLIIEQKQLDLLLETLADVIRVTEEHS